MTIDPAVQAARLVYDAWSSSQDETRNFDTMVAVMTTVLPLIRAQAFTEAADAIAAMRIAVTNGDTAAIACNGAISHAAALVRGLGER